MNENSKKIKWEDIVKIQYDALLRSSVIYVTILSAVAVLAKQLCLSNYAKLALFAAFVFVLLQVLAVLYLTNIQRHASWEDGNDNLLNERENRVRAIVLWLSSLTTVSIIVTVALVLCTEIFPLAHPNCLSA